MVIEKFVFDADAQTLTLKVVADTTEEEVDIRAWICNQNDFSCVNDIPEIPLVDSDGSAEITSDTEIVLDLEYAVTVASTNGSNYDLNKDLFFVYITYGSETASAATISGVKPMYDSVTVYTSILDKILGSVDVCNCCDTINNLPLAPIILFEGAVIALNIAEYQDAITLWNKYLRTLTCITSSSTSSCACNS